MEWGVFFLPTSIIQAVFAHQVDVVEDFEVCLPRPNTGPGKRMRILMVDSPKPLQ